QTPCEPAPPASTRTRQASACSSRTAPSWVATTSRAGSSSAAPPPEWPPSTGPQPSPPSTQEKSLLRRRTAAPRLAASIADGIPVSLIDAITGLDRRNLSHLLAAIRHRF